MDLDVIDHGQDSRSMTLNLNRQGHIVRVAPNIKVSPVVQQGLPIVNLGCVRPTFFILSRRVIMNNDETKFLELNRDSSGLA